MNVDEKREGGILSELDWDIEPESELWPKIETSLAPRRKAVVYQMFRKTAGYFAVAASILMAGVFYHSSKTEVVPSNLANSERAIREHQLEHINLMALEHKQVRSELLHLLDHSELKLDALLVAYIRETILTIDTAVLELQAAALNASDVADYSLMLANTYRQETDILNMLSYSRSSTI